VLIAIICSLGAWWFRISIAKKRKDALIASALSWDGDAKNNGGIFGAQRAAHFRDAIESNSSSIADLSGDRDVGEPRRGSVYHLPASILHRGTADSFSSSTVLSRVFSGAEHARHNSLPVTSFPNASFPDVSFPAESFPMTDSPYPTTRPLPRRFSTGFTVDENIGTLGPLQVANMVWGDIEDMSRPSSRQDMERIPRTGFGTPRGRWAGDRLGGPWTSAVTEPARTKDPVMADARAQTIRYLSSQTVDEPIHIGTNRDDFPPLPTPGEDSSQRASYRGSDSLEKWATVLESNYTNTFRASRPGRGILPSQDAFGSDRDLVNDQPLQQGGSNWRDNFEDQVFRRTNTGSTVVSNPWTLEETGNGAGVVHIRGLGVAYNGSDQAFVSPSQTSLAFDNESIRSADLMDVVSQAPFVVLKQSKAAPDEQHQHRGLSRRHRKPKSPEGSSPASIKSSEDGYYPLIERPSISRIPRLSRVDNTRTFKSKKEAVTGLSKMARSSSPSSSLISFRLGKGWSAKEQAAKTETSDMRKSKQLGLGVEDRVDYN
jgi:hypothetical protein